MLLEAQSRGWEVYYMQLQDLFMESGTSLAHAQKITTIFRHVAAWPFSASRQSFVLLSICFAIPAARAVTEDDFQSCIESSASAQL